MKCDDHNAVATFSKIHSLADHCSSIKLSLYAYYYRPSTLACSITDPEHLKGQKVREVIDLSQFATTDIQPFEFKLVLVFMVTLGFYISV